MHHHGMFMCVRGQIIYWIGINENVDVDEDEDIWSMLPGDILDEIWWWWMCSVDVNGLLVVSVRMVV